MDPASPELGPFFGTSKFLLVKFSYCWSSKISQTILYLNSCCSFDLFFRSFMAHVCCLVHPFDLVKGDFRDPLPKDYDSDDEVVELSALEI